MSAARHEEILASTLILPTGMTLDDDELHAFAITVEWRGPRTDTGRGGWAVQAHGRDLSRAGNWGHPDHFQQHQYRWATREEALEMAHEHVDAISVNGNTWAGWQEHWKNVSEGVAQQ